MFKVMTQACWFTKTGFHRGTIFLLLTVAFVMLGPASGTAEDVRLPKTGDPAFAVDVPDGWTTLYDEHGNLRIIATDRTCFIQLSMITGADVKLPMREVAVEIIKSAGASPFSATEPGAIARQHGTVYMTTLTNPAGLRLDFKLVLAKFDAAHIGSLAVLKAPNLSAARIAALDELIGRIRLTGLNH
jgi:hypothetical protein